MITHVPPSAPASSAGSAKLRSIDLRGPAGRLEALLNEGAPQARYAALLCHPHPLGGGSMHNKVVYHAMKALNAPEFGLGLPVLRFNFRGTGLSEGAHHGMAETADVAAALNWLAAEFDLPIVLAGFSFGAAMALYASCDPETSAQLPLHPSAHVRAIAALGLPTLAEGRHYRYPFLSQCTLPKLFLSGDRDEFAPAEDLRDVAATTADPKRIVLLHGADHFFAGQLDAMQNELARWLKELLA